MKFKIIDVYQQGVNLQVIVAHKHCHRQVFSFPIQAAKNNQYIETITKILTAREQEAKIKIDTNIINKEFELQKDKNKTEIKTKKEPKI